MRNLDNKVVIVGGQRTPFTKSFGKYSQVSNQRLLTSTLNALVHKYDLVGKKVGDVALGSLIKSPSDWNLARESVLGSRLDSTTQAYDLQRACGTSLEAVNQIALKIAAGQIENGIAGGSDTNSDLPIMFSKKFSHKLLALRNARTVWQKVFRLFRFSATDFKPQIPGVVEPRTGMSMGEHTELMVKNWKISREEQDNLAYLSHKNASEAYKNGFYEDLIFEFNGLTKDTITRDNTSLEKLARLQPAFDKSESGSLTAGNSTPLTDGAAAILLASEKFAQVQGWPVLAYLTDVASAAVNYVEGEDLLIAPTVAVADMLKRNFLTLQDFDFYEIHEAFSGQVLSTLKAWEDEAYCKNRLGWNKPLGSIDRSKLNVKGGSVALGHPFAATGARIMAQAAKILHELKGKRALVSVCTAGGMGVVAIIERH